MDNVFVIDGNGERRAEIGHVLMEGGGHAEPFETIDEFLAFGSNEGTALVSDEDGAAIRLCEKMRDKPRLVPVVGYALSPDIGQVVAAMQAGAVSYLGWPFTRTTLTEELARIAPMVKRTLAEQRRRAHASALLAGLIQSGLIRMFSATATSHDGMIEAANRIAMGDLAGATTILPDVGRALLVQSYDNAFQMQLYILAAASVVTALIVFALLGRVRTHDEDGA